MKRKELIKWLRKNGAVFIREGQRHTIYEKDSFMTEIPRHREIIDILANKICRDLRIPYKGRQN